MTQASDIELVDAVLSGDDSAFEELILRYQKPIMSLVIRYTSKVNDAADIAQKVFIKVYTKLSSFKRLSTFKTWLFAIAINICRNELRRDKKWGVPQNVDDLQLGLPAGLDEGIVKTQKRKILVKALAHLPPKQKSVLILRVYEEMTFAEIARASGITENSAKVNYHHAVKKLKNIIEEMNQERDLK